jgi:hypothetical protein
MPCWWIKQTEAELMARSVKQLEAWAQLIRLCDDDCQTFSTTKEMRAAVLEVERELRRLHKIEGLAIILAQKFKRIRGVDDDSVEIDRAMDDLWGGVGDQIAQKIEALVPEAFTEEAMIEAVTNAE